METLTNHQVKSRDFFASHTFYNEREKVKEIISDFTNKGLINFKDGDFTSIFTLFGKEFNNAKHSLLIPIDTAWERLTTAINKEKSQLPNDFIWSAVAEYKYKKGQGWRLHFHLLHNYRLNLFEYSEGNNEVLYNSEYFIGNYLIKDFQFTINQGIAPYVFSSNYKETINKRTSKIISTILLYSINKNITNYKQKVKEVNNYCSDLFRPLLFNVPPRCRASPYPL